MSREYEVDVVCSHCEKWIGVVVEISGDPRDPSWTAYDTKCPICGKEMTKEVEREVEEKAYAADEEPQFQYDTWDEYLMDKEM